MTVVSFMLDQIQRTHNVTLQPEWVQSITVQTQSLDGGLRRALVQMAPPYDQAYTDFTVDYTPINLATRFPGGALYYFGLDHDGEIAVSLPLVLALIQGEQGVDLYDDDLSLVELSGRLELVAGENSVLYTGRLILFTGQGPLDALVASQGGAARTVTRTSFVEQMATARLRYLVAEQGAIDGRVAQILVSARREMVDQGALALNGAVSLGGDQPVAKTIALEHEISDYTDLYAFGMGTVTGAGAVQCTVMEGAEGEGSVVYDQPVVSSVWTQFPVTTASQRLTFTALGDPTLGVGIEHNFRLMRLQNISQPVAEYRPLQEQSADGHDALRFEGMQRLDSGPTELYNLEHSLFAVLDTDVTSSGTSQLVALVPTSGDTLALRYDHSGQVRLTYGSVEAVVPVAANQGRVVVYGTIYNQTLVVAAGDDAAASLPLTNIPTNLGTAILRVGGNNSAPFRISQCGHYRGSTELGMIRHFIKRFL
jgi:hypothetical protein